MLVAAPALAVRFLNNPITTSQNLASGALSYTTAFPAGRTFKVDEVTLKASTGITETVTITRDSATGSNYDVVLVSETLSSATSFVFRPSGECTFFKGDQLKIQCTNNGTTGTVYVEIRTSEIG